jgi:hypothetical protein
MYYFLLVLVFGAVVYYEYDQNTQLQDKIQSLQNQVASSKLEAEQSADNEEVERKRLAEALARPQITLPPPVIAPTPPVVEAPLTGLPTVANDLIQLYGKPDNQYGPTGAIGMPSTYYSGQLSFTHEGMTILANSQRGHVTDLTITRSEAFNPLEIPDILKPLSVDEDWKQIDDKDWLLPGKAKAHWDGEGTITIQ